MDFVDAVQLESSTEAAETTVSSTSTVAPPLEVDVSWCGRVDGASSAIFAAQLRGWTTGSVNYLYLKPRVEAGELRGVAEIAQAAGLSEVQWDTACREAIAETGAVAVGEIVVFPEPSIYAVPTDAAAAEWAENAAVYAEEQNWRWDSRDDAVDFYARYASARCRALSLPPSDTPAQVEAHLRNQVGIEGWESFGQAWYDSLVNGLCIRR
jgi:hypothetical protein